MVCIDSAVGWAHPCVSVCVTVPAGAKVQESVEAAKQKASEVRTVGVCGAGGAGGGGQGVGGRGAGRQGDEAEGMRFQAIRTAAAGCTCAAGSAAPHAHMLHTHTRQRLRGPQCGSSMTSRLDFAVLQGQLTLLPSPRQSRSGWGSGRSASAAVTHCESRRRSEALHRGPLEALNASAACVLGPPDCPPPPPLPHRCVASLGSGVGCVSSWWGAGGD